MSSNEIAIKISNLSKCYEIYDSPRDRLKQFLIPKFINISSLVTKKFYREFWALKDVSFEVKKGETVGIIGSNGSGKSTLLQIICGTLTPTNGNVETHGRVAALLELGSGFNPEFTGRENIYMYASVLGLCANEVDQRFNDIIKFAEIGEFVDQPIKTYSSGMTLRLAFAVIAHVDADILVIDEALAVGDAFFTQKCMRFLKTFMKKGTVLFVSHDTRAVMNLCNKAILINHGHLENTGAPKEVAEHYLSTLYASDKNADKQDKLSNNTPSNIHHEEFGTGNARIISAEILGQDNKPLNYLEGGEDIALTVHCIANKNISNPIIGFQFKDRLGQVVFADNTTIACQLSNYHFIKGSEFSATFEFQIPLLQSGHYSVTTAIAEELNESLIQHHWIHDALTIKVNSNGPCYGLIGVSMKQITLSKL